MSNLIIYLGILKRINVFFGFIFAIGTIILIAIAIGMFCYKSESKESYNSEKIRNHYINMYNLLKKHLLKSVVIWSIFAFLFLCIPTKKEFLSYIVLSEVDTYNIKNIDSKLNPQEVIRTGDTLIKTIDNVFKKINKEIETK